MRPLPVGVDFDETMQRVQMLTQFPFPEPGQVESKAGAVGLLLEAHARLSSGGVRVVVAQQMECIEALANQVQLFLSAYLLSVIANATFSAAPRAWGRIPVRQRHDCQSRDSWLKPSAWMIRSSAESASSAPVSLSEWIGTRDASGRPARGPDWKLRLDIQTAIGTERALGVERQMACTAGSYRDLAVRSMTALTLGSKSYHAQEIAALGTPGRRPAHPLFGLGAHYSLGRLFHSAFSFSAHDVIGPTGQALAEAGLSLQRREANSLWIGIHMRHPWLGYNGSELVGQFGHAVAATLRRRRPWSTCAILAAADRPLAISLLERFVRRETHCVFATSIVDQAGRRQHGRRLSGEHGDAGAVQAPRDLFLLSRADVVIGTLTSSFTLLAHELVAARYTGGPVPEAVLCSPHQKGCTPPMPLVSDAADGWWYTSLARWPRGDIRTERLRDGCGGEPAGDLVAQVRLGRSGRV